MFEIQLSMPGGVVEIVTMTLIPLLSMKIRNSRLWCTSAVVLVALLGTALVFTLPYEDKGGLLAGYWLVRSGATFSSDRLC